MEQLLKDRMVRLKAACPLAKAGSRLCQQHAHFLSPEETTANRFCSLTYQIFSTTLQALHVSIIHGTCTYTYTFTEILSVIQCMFEGILEIVKLLSQDLRECSSLQDKHLSNIIKENLGE